MDPVKIAEAFYYLQTQDRSCWTHELQLTPFPTKPSYGKPPNGSSLAIVTPRVGCLAP